MLRQPAASPYDNELYGRWFRPTAGDDAMQPWSGNADPRRGSGSAEHDAAGVLEGRPRGQWIAPVHSIVQQQPIDEGHLRAPTW